MANRTPYMSEDEKNELHTLESTPPDKMTGGMLQRRGLLRAEREASQRSELLDVLHGLAVRVDVDPGDRVYAAQVFFEVKAGRSRH